MEASLASELDSGLINCCVFSRTEAPKMRHRKALA